jgi:hypothetical protein
MMNFIHFDFIHVRMAKYYILRGKGYSNNKFSTSLGYFKKDFIMFMLPRSWDNIVAQNQWIVH